MKFFARFSCVLFALLILGLGVLTFALPDPAFSETENRYLATLPRVSLNDIVSGEFTKNTAAFVADHVPFRTVLLEGKALCECMLGRCENGNTIIAEDGYLIKRLSLGGYFEDNLLGIKALKSSLETGGVPTAFVCAPRAIDVMTHVLPSLYPKDSAEAVQETLDRIAPFAVFPAKALAVRAENGEQVFFRTDHHLSPLGAHRIYFSLGETLGYEPLPLCEFTEEVAATDFYGTSASAALFPFAVPDTITLYRYDGDDMFTVTDLATGKKQIGFYREEYLQKKDKYAVFLGGNFAHLHISNGSEKPRLLLVKDSFANAMLPFLARHFDIDMVDLRYVKGDKAAFLQDLLRQTHFDRALFLFNVDTLCTDPSLALFSANSIDFM